MPPLVLMLTCERPHTGPWFRLQGRERGVKVFPELSSAEEILVDMAGSTNTVRTVRVSQGVTQLDFAGAVKCRIRKVGQGTPTTVELVNGKARS